jgi:filamentous hemagglutinin family protein
MIKQRKLGLVVLTAVIAAGYETVTAQIVPDTTLGVESSVVTPKSDGIDVIEGGATRGANLFHSFEHFSIPTGKTAFFNNTPAIQNIISRITGKNVSNIDGLIRANGSANLFLLNPNGIVFGSNARLDIGGSFVASAASSLKFADGKEFTTTSSTNTPLLTISTPIGLQLGSGAVTNTGNLNVKPQQSLTLLSNKIYNNGYLSASGGEVTLAALPIGTSFPLGQFPVDIMDIEAGIQENQIGTTINSGRIDVSGEVGGTVKILGDEVGIFADSVINASGNTGGGKIFVGGNYQGRGELPNSRATYISPTATIQANAITTGNGGQIVVWSNQSTRAYGNFQARGADGNGGLIETSSANFLDVTGIKVDATTNNNLSGTWLLDPRNITLGYPGTSTNGNFSDRNPNIFTPTGDNAVVNILDIIDQLNAGTNVIISTGSTGNQDGNIFGENFGINKTTASPATLTLQAANNITLENFLIDSKSGLLNVLLQTDKGNINLTNGGIFTAGGEFTATAQAISLQNARINSDAGINNAAPINLTANAIAFNNGSVESTTSNSRDTAPINITGKLLTFQGGVIKSDTSSTGNGTPITLNVDSINLQGGSIYSSASSNGNASPISFNTKSMTVLQTGINSNTSGVGSGGLITINTDLLKVGRLTPTGSGSGINSNTSGIGNAGGVNINANTIEIDKSGIASNTTGDGKAGNINIKVNSSAILTESGINSDASSNGNAGDVNINANVIDIKQAGIGSTTSGIGNAGAVSLNADNVKISGGINSNTSNSGSSGGVTIDARSIEVEKGAIQSNSTGDGNAGNINLTAESILLLGQSGINVNTDGDGQGGNVNLQTGTLLVQNQSGIGGTAKGIGNTGTVNINADTITLNNQAGINSNTEGIGNAGGIKINTNSLVIEKSSGLTSEAKFDSKGDAGTIEITAPNFIIVKDGGSISSKTFGEGDAGNITIKTGSLSILGGQSGISNDARENSKGNAGIIDITADSLLGESNPQGNGILSETRSSGNSGQIKLKVNNLVLRNGSNISTSTFDNKTTGNAGQIEITADSVLFENNIPDVNSGLGSVTRGVGKGGEIILNADRVTLKNRAGISINTLSAGNAGTLTLNADSLILENAAIVSENFGTGEGGDINLKINQDLDLRNSTISVSSKPLDQNNNPVGTAGDIDIQASSLFLDNQSSLQGEAASVNGGDIRLQLQDLLRFSRNSKISTNAGTASLGGNGGNIIINAPSGFIVAVPSENNDITANAFTGSGGNVQINAYGIFGIQFRPLENPITSDITASSRFGNEGVVNINTPEVDPNRGLVELPTNLVDASQQIAQSCNASGKRSSFTVTGRGGIPVSPVESLMSDAVLADWITLQPQFDGGRAINITSPMSQSSKIVEAQGWVVDDRGDVILVAQTPSVNSTLSRISSSFC